MKKIMMTRLSVCSLGVSCNEMIDTLKKSLSFQNMMFIRKDDTLVTERKRSNNKHMYKLEASRVN